MFSSPGDLEPLSGRSEVTASHSVDPRSVAGSGRETAANTAAAGRAMSAFEAAEIAPRVRAVPRPQVAVTHVRASHDDQRVTLARAEIRLTEPAGRRMRLVPGGASHDRASWVHRSLQVPGGECR